MNPQSLIRSANKACKFLFTESTFFLSLDTDNYIRLTGNSMSPAVNHHKNDNRQVNVLYWFDNYWLFIEMKISDNNKSISISIFQGEQNDDEKYQLLRAEWDDFGNDKENHAQPHWHITVNQAIERAIEKFADVVDNDEGFMDVLEEEKTKFIDVERLHFAMSGNWQNSGTHIHTIDDETKVVNWLKGVLLHLRNELKYVKNRSNMK